MKCHDCVNSHDSPDGKLRCVPGLGAECNETRAALCGEYRREPGADAEEIEVNLCAGCEGRGD